MPTAQMKGFAEKYDVPLNVIEGFWDKAKAEYGEDWSRVAGAVKAMAKNYKKGKDKKMKESYIEKSLGILVECGDGPCKCKGKGKGKGKCKCKKKKGLAAMADELEGMTEGRTKRALEAKVEKACTCDGGASLDPDDHDKSCPAQKIIAGEVEDVTEEKKEKKTRCSCGWDGKDSELTTDRGGHTFYCPKCKKEVSL